MSKETIKAIRAAEAEADTIRAEALRRANQLEETARQEGEQLLLQTEQNVTQELKALMRQMQEQAERLGQKEERVARDAAGAVCETASRKKRSAIKLILRGITD